MSVAERDTRFVGSIPALYDECLGPVIFHQYADDLAARVVAKVSTGRVLEIACGTGLLTRRLDAALPPGATNTATDLNVDMIAYAKAVVPPSGRIEWRTADAADLPFDDATFSAAVCQFGLMFVPDKAAAFREARRVLRRDGWFVFNVWCGIEDNPFARIGNATIARFFKGDPPTFYQVPFGFHDADVIGEHMRSNGFADVTMEHVTLQTTAASTHQFARGLVEGNPVVSAIHEAKLPVAEIVDSVASALTAHGGDAPFRSTMKALVCCGRAA